MTSSAGISRVIGLTSDVRGTCIASCLWSGRVGGVGMGWRGQARLRPLETADSRYGSVREVQQSSEDSCSVAPSTHLSSPMIVEDVDTMSVLSYNRASVCLCVCMSVHSVSLST